VNAEVQRVHQCGPRKRRGRGCAVSVLRAEAIAAAGLDVLAHEPNVSDDLLALDSLTILPPIGSASVSTRTAMADLVAQNVIAWF